MTYDERLHRRASLRHSVNLGVDQTWSEFATLRTWASWMPTVDAVDGDGPLRSGATFTLRGDFLHGQTSLGGLVVVATAPSHLLLSIDGLYQLSVDLRFTAAGTGTEVAVIATAFPQDSATAIVVDRSLGSIVERIHASLDGLGQRGELSSAASN